MSKFWMITKVADKLIKSLDEAKEDMEYLWKFLIVAGARIGFMEGRLEKSAGSPSQLKIKELADARNKYEKKLIAW